MTLMVLAVPHHELCQRGTDDEGYNANMVQLFKQVVIRPDCSSNA